MDLLVFVVDRHSDREPLDEYINKKREMFLVQVSVCINVFPSVLFRAVCAIIF